MEGSVNNINSKNREDSNPIHPSLAEVGSGAGWGEGTLCGLVGLCCVSSGISALSPCPRVLCSHVQVHCWLGMGEEKGWKHP